MCRSLITIPLLLLCMASFAQKKLLRKARYHFNTASYYKAAETYLKLLAIDSTNKTWLYETGLAYYYSNFEKTRSLPYMLASQRHSGGDTIPETFFMIADVQHLQGDFKSALKNFERFKSILEVKSVHSDGKVKQTVEEELEQKIAWCKTGMMASVGQTSVGQTLEMMFPGEVNKTPVKLTVLDSNVNSRFDDYSTLLSPNDDKLYFTTRRKEGIKNYIDYFDIKHFEDIYVSEKNGGTWKPSVPLPGEVNTKKRHEATNFLTKDGKILYVYQGVRTGTMFMSREENGAWTKPEKVKGAGLNSKHWETSLSFCMSNDGIMYIVSDRPGGFGGRDIYQSKKQGDGTWGPLENLGGSINTKFDEDGPYITPDGKTLYYASNGPASIGGFDIFRCELVDGKWSTPVNLGAGFNSTGDDIFFHFSNTGKSAYFSSSRLHRGLNDMDIYCMEEILPEQDTLPVLPVFKDSVIEFPSTPKSWSLQPVYFDFGKYLIKDVHRPALDSLVTALKADPDLKVEVQGHADAKGSSSINEKLSMRRAKSISDYLLGKGIPADRITTISYGESRPAFPNTNVQNRQKNRRVEIQVIAK